MVIPALFGYGSNLDPTHLIALNFNQSNALNKQWACGRSTRKCNLSGHDVTLAKQEICNLGKCETWLRLSKTFKPASWPKHKVCAYCGSSHRSSDVRWWRRFTYRNDREIESKAIWQHRHRSRCKKIVVDAALRCVWLNPIAPTQVFSQSKANGCQLGPLR